MERGAKRPVKRCLLASGAFLVGFPLFALLHNLLDYAAHRTSDVFLIGDLLGFVSVACFLIAIFVCPAGFVFCLFIAGLFPLTARLRKPVRWSLLIVLPLIAGVGGVFALAHFLRLSTIERDETVGFNGGFEVVKDGLPVNWYVLHRAFDAGTATLSFDTTDPVEGLQALKIAVLEEPADRNWKQPGLFQLIEAGEGESFSVGLWLKSEGATLRILIASEPEQEGEMLPGIVDLLEPGRTGDGEWRHYAYTYSVPAHHRDVRIDLAVGTPGTVWIDDVRIDAVP